MFNLCPVARMEEDDDEEDSVDIKHLILWTKSPIQSPRRSHIQGEQPNQLPIPHKVDSQEMNTPKRHEESLQLM
jgi:hypothetical protein